MTLIKVAIVDTKHDRTFRAKQLSTGQRKCAIEYAKQMLQGVGMMPSTVQQNELAFHYRKSLSPEEIDMLPQDWCAIPPRDEGGSGIILERNT